MDTRYLDTRLRELGVYESFRHRFEYRKLGAVLPPEGAILDAAGGIFRGKRRLIFAMEDSWYFISAHPVSGVEVVVIPVEKIELVRSGTFLLFGTLVLRIEGEEEKIANMDRKAPDRFAKLLMP
jgi:hypothetical protein